jgi:hypothetical protein
MRMRCDGLFLAVTVPSSSRATYIEKFLRRSYHLGWILLGKISDLLDFKTLIRSLFEFLGLKVFHHHHRVLLRSGSILQIICTVIVLALDPWCRYWLHPTRVLLSADRIAIPRFEWCTRQLSRHRVRLLLIPVSRLTKQQLALCRATTLLNHMGQFVSQKASTFRIIGVVRSLAEENIPADSKRYSADSAAEGISLSISVYADVPKIGAEG